MDTACVHLLSRAAKDAVDLDIVTLNEEDKKKYVNISDPGKRKELLSSRAFIKYILETEYAVEFSSFQKDKNKPILLGSNFNISLSHSQKYIAFLILPRPIFGGVDIETKLANEHLALANKYFSQMEVEWITSFKSISLQRKAFQRLWSLRESYFKSKQEEALSCNKALEIDFQDKFFSSTLDKELGFFLSYQNDAFSISVYCENKESKVKTFAYKQESEGFINSEFTVPWVKIRGRQHI